MHLVTLMAKVAAHGHTVLPESRGISTLSLSCMRQTMLHMQNRSETIFFRKPLN
jgi:hypothetical protein